MKRKLAILVVVIGMMFGLSGTAQASTTFLCAHPAQGIHYYYGDYFHSVQRWISQGNYWALGTVYKRYWTGSYYTYVRQWGTLNQCGPVYI